MLNTGAKSATARTGLGSICGIDIFHCNPPLQGLVLNKGLQLTEGPGMEIGPLCFPLFSPFPNVGQLFHHDYIACLEPVHDGFTDAVVQVAHNADLFTMKAFQKLFSSIRPFSLETCSQLAVMPPNVHCLFATKPLAIGGNSQVYHANINTDPLARLGRWINFPLDNNVEIECLGLLVIDEISGSVDLPIVQERFLETAKDHRDFDSAADGGNRSLPILGNAESSGVKSDRRIRAELTECMPIALFISLSDLISCCTCKLGWQSKAFPHTTISHVVKGDFIGNATIIMRYFRDIVAGITELANRLQHGLSLFSARVQFAPHGLGQLWHSKSIITHIGGEVKGLCPCGCSSPQQATGFPQPKF